MDRSPIRANINERRRENISRERERERRIEKGRRRENIPRE